MISENTVFILGAGASCPYGFPSGRKLVSQTCDVLRNFRSYPIEIIAKYFQPEKEVRTFANELLSSHLSIDAFLEEHPHYLSMGRAAIALALVPLERREVFARGSQGGWYEYLCQQMGANRERFLQNATRLSVITFNYDRSLEYYLLYTLTNSFDGEMAFKIIKEIPFIHVYGQLGVPLYQNNQGRDYVPWLNGTPNVQDIVKCVENIKIMPERSDDSSEFRKAHELISRAHKICFLGFGYDETNLRRLGIKHHFGGSTVYGSAFELEDDEIRRAKDLIAPVGSDIRILSILGKSDEDALTFLRRYPIFA